MEFESHIIVKFTDAYSLAYLPFVRKQMLKIDWLYKKMLVEEPEKKSVVDEMISQFKVFMSN